MYSDYFTLESAARDYRNEWQAWAERERRLALLSPGASPAAKLFGLLHAALSALTGRPIGPFLFASRGGSMRPAREHAHASLIAGSGND